MNMAKQQGLFDWAKRQARIKQLRMAIIALENKDRQGPEGRTELDKLRKELAYELSATAQL